MGVNRSVSDQSCCIRGTNSKFVAALYRTMTASRGISARRMIARAECFMEW